MNSKPSPLRLRAPAKVNLGLRLVGRRDDGYHLLESIFAPLDLADEIEIELLPSSSGGSPEASGEGETGGAVVDLEVLAAAGAELPSALSQVPADADNLVVRAARQFCAAHGFSPHLRIRLHKAIPAGAGLGGGSSDAAALLSGLVRLLGESREGPTLPEIALRLGADVPFFLDQRLAHVAGVGEELTPIQGLPEISLVLANPGISLDTADVYRAADALGGSLTDPGAGSTMRAFSRLRGGCQGPREAVETESGTDQRRALWADLLVNDLMPAARRLCPPVGRLLDRIEETGALGSSLSGSGATVFGVYATRADAEKAAAELGSNAADCPWVRVSRLV